MTEIASSGQRGAAKMLPHANAALPEQPLPIPRKPAWIRAKLPNQPAAKVVREQLRRHQLHTVCEEAACPNLGECFSAGTASFLILGEICTRRCPFCDVAHGRPQPPDAGEPVRLAAAVAAMALHYVVITSVDRDDLRDGGAAHFAACVQALRAAAPGLRIEILTPDFRGRMSSALDALAVALPDVFNHNIETVLRLYPNVRPGADYAHSLQLLAAFHQRFEMPVKSGLMLGLGETHAEVEATLADLRAHHCTMLTLGQYLQPSRHHLPVQRYAPPEEFVAWAELAKAMGFIQVASAPLARSSYHAEQLAEGLTWPDTPS